MKRVRAKGLTYYYFDTGKLKPNQQRIYARLPDIASKHFGTAYAAQLGVRTKALGFKVLLTVAQLIDMYQRSKEFAARSPNTKATYNVYLRLLDEKIGNAPAEGLEKRDVLALLDSMADRTGAANMTLGVLGALYAWGRGRDHVKAEPTKGIELFVKRDYEPWPDALLAEAMVGEDDRVRRLVALLYFTAQRIGDVARMRWDDIKGDVLFVTQQKTGKPLEIPVHRDLLRILGARPNMDRPLIGKPDGTHYSKESLRHTLQSWAKLKGHKIVPHGLRKNAVNALLEAGCSVAETASVSGQSLGMVEHYAKRRSNAKLAKRAIAKLERPNGEQENNGKQPQ